MVADRTDGAAAGQDEYADRELGGVRSGMSDSPKNGKSVQKSTVSIAHGVWIGRI